MTWAMPPMDREQLVLFTTSLDEVIPEDHWVRVVDEILRTLDWSEFEKQYHGSRGARPVHPRVVASIILYGHLTRVRASRQLEAALWLRLDFRWLAEGEQLDHTTISNFRKEFAEPLKGISTQFGVLAYQLGVTTLTQFGFDGTRLRANSARQRTVDVSRLDEIERKIQQAFAELEQQAAQADAQDDEQLGGASRHRLPEELQQTKNRLAAVRRAKAEIDRVKAASQPVPERIPLTDPESRVSPNKEGGFAPNYTPLAGVDLESGLIVSDDVIPNTDEEQYLVESVASIEARFADAGLEQRVESLAADGLFVTGPNLEALAHRHTTLYGPITAQPEIVQRADGRTPIPETQWEKLPTTVLRKGQNGQPDQVQLAKEAFLYDAESNCYWCPRGQPLSYTGTTSEVRKATQRRVTRQRYRAAESACASCPLRAKCLQAQGTTRTLSRDQYESHRETLRQRMTETSSSDHLKKRQSEGERPFAMVKQQFGIRQFLLRGLANVRKEWRWMTSAVNLKILIRHWREQRDRVAALRLAPPSSLLKPGRAGARASPTLVGT